MGYQLSHSEFDTVLSQLQKDYDIYAPIRLMGKGRYSELDCIRYGKVSSVKEIVHNQKSEFSPKELAFPINETMFYFNGERTEEAESKEEKGILVFLRTCDIEGFDRIDTIFMDNGGVVDPFYAKRRERIKFIRMGCKEGFHNCFCFSFNTNETEDYVIGVDFNEEGIAVEIKDSTFESFFSDYKAEPVKIDYVLANDVTVNIPDTKAIDDLNIFYHTMWDQYTKRCIACGRCNFVCPTCTCFNVLDMFYEDNAHVGERKRTWASCHVDGYTNMAGGHSFRGANGERMRFKTLHKIYDYKKRFGKHMCIGCGRCDDVCPEYISYANAVNQIQDIVMEGK